MTHLFSLSLIILVACGSEPRTTEVAAPAASTTAAVATTTAAPAAPAAPKSEAERTVLDVALGSPDHTTLVAAVKAADAAAALGSPGGIYTVFAPTNAAFDKLPPGTVESLLKPENKGQLSAIIQHHAMVPILETSAMTDGQVLGMADGTSVTLHVKDGKVMVDDANIVASVKAMNGVVHVVDAVLLPKPK